MAAAPERAGAASFAAPDGPGAGAALSAGAAFVVDEAGPHGLRMAGPRQEYE